ncbi:MAG: DUF6569 family protein [Polyangiaceae bacterium]
MKLKSHGRVLASICGLLATILILAACKSPAPSAAGPYSERTAAEGQQATVVSESTTVELAVTGEPLGDGVFVGKGRTFDNLTIFPILAKTQVDPGPLMSLDEALEKGVAEVREIGAQAGGESPPVQVPQVANQAPQQPQIVQQASPIAGGSAQVGTLVIENRGHTPIYVLAGTIVKGGKQDRQIGQDFIIGAAQTTPVDAFCVEHGRWTAERDGRQTGGRFTTVKQLANAEVRMAGQYEKNQGEVWSKVSKVNEAHKKVSASDSLLASADDAQIKAERDALTHQVRGYLGEVETRGAVVGIAYAVDGKIKGVRWFAHHRVFSMFNEAIVNSSVVDALTAKAAGGAASAPPSASDVVAFVTSAEQGEQKRVEDTAAENVNSYVEAPDAYGSKTRMKSSPKPVSQDYMAK